MVFQKGGLIGLAIIMDNQQRAIPGVNSMALGKQIEAELRANHSGARAGYETVVLSGVKDVKQLNNLSHMQPAFLKGSDKVTKSVYITLGVPYTRGGVVSDSSQQYHPAALEDDKALQFNKSISEVLRPVDKFLNNKFIPALGVKDVQIRARERMDFFTQNIGNLLVQLGKLDGFITKNEGRSIAHLSMLQGKEGNMPLRVLPNMSVTSDIIPPPKAVPISDNENEDMRSTTNS
jgi:hypothetical protein